MRARLYYLAMKIRGSFWFLPMAMVLIALALAWASLEVDRSGTLAEHTRGLWFGPLDEASARLVLSTISGAMITVASLVFSMTLVSLTLASRQLGPRLISMLLRDTITQSVLGVFLATFVYALVVLMALSGDRGPVLVPMLSISLAVAFTVLSFVALITFIHHLATSLQADVVVARVAAHLEEQIRNQFEELTAGSGPGARHTEEPPARRNGRAVAASESGYIQTIDYDDLLSLACERELCIDVPHRPGHFLCEGETIAVLAPEDAWQEDCEPRVRQAIVFGAARTPAEDVEFAILAIVEVALRALSPGVNDPHTAIACVDRLGAAVSLVFGRRLRAPVLQDEQGAIRVTRDVVTEDGIVDTAFDEIRQCAERSVAVMIRIAAALERLAGAARTPAQRETVARHCQRLARAGEDAVSEPDDLQALRDALERALERCRAGDG